MLRVACTRARKQLCTRYCRPKRGWLHPNNWRIIQLLPVRCDCERHMFHFNTIKTWSSNCYGALSSQCGVHNVHVLAWKFYYEHCTSPARENGPLSGHDTGEWVFSTQLIKYIIHQALTHSVGEYHFPQRRCEQRIQYNTLTSILGMNKANDPVRLAVTSLLRLGYTYASRAPCLLFD